MDGNPASAAERIYSSWKELSGTPTIYGRHGLYDCITNFLCVRREEITLAQGALRELRKNITLVVIQANVQPKC